MGSGGSDTGSGPGRGASGVCHNKVTCPCAEICVTGRGGAGQYADLQEE